MLKTYPATYIFPYLVVRFDHETVVFKQNRYEDLGPAVEGGLSLGAVDLRYIEGPRGPVWGNVIGADARLHLRHVRNRHEIRRALKLAAVHGGYEGRAC